MPPKHDAGTATRHYRAFWQRRCRAAAAGAVLKPSGGNCAVLPRISPDQTKSAQPRRQAGAARLCAKAKSLLFFLCFCLRNQNGVRSFCTADPLSLLRVWIVLIIAYCQNFASTFCRYQGDFCRRLPYFIKLFLRFSSRIPVFAFFFSVKLSFGLNNFKITAFPPHHWVMPGSGRPSPAALFRCFLPALRCHSLVYRRVSLPISYVIQNLALFLALSYHSFISNVRFILWRVFPPFSNIIYFVNNHCIGCKH